MRIFIWDWMRQTRRIEALEERCGRLKDFVKLRDEFYTTMLTALSDRIRRLEPQIEPQKQTIVVDKPEAIKNGE